MISKVFSVYDSKAVMFNVPFFQASTGAGVRAFSDLVNDERAKLVFDHPGDFVLYEIGEFNDEDGSMVNYKEHKHLGVGSQYKEQEKINLASRDLVQAIKNGPTSEVK